MKMTRTFQSESFSFSYEVFRILPQYRNVSPVNQGHIIKKFHLDDVNENGRINRLTILSHAVPKLNAITAIRLKRIFEEYNTTPTVINLNGVHAAHALAGEDAKVLISTVTVRAEDVRDVHVTVGIHLNEDVSEGLTAISIGDLEPMIEALKRIN